MSDSAALRRWCAGTILAGLAVVLGAVLAPVHLPVERDDPDSSGTVPPGAPESAPEDLGAFVANRRWGVSLREVREAEAAKAAPAMPAEIAVSPEPSVHPALAKMGFVGLIVTNDRSAVLLASPGGGVDRFVPGDTLPDGRTLVSVTDNSLTLRGDGLPEEVLSLFPRVGADVPADERGGDAGGSRPAE